MIRSLVGVAVIFALLASLPSTLAVNCGCTCSATVTIPGLSYFPPGILDQLRSLTGYNALQITCILGMIQGPEQGRWQWWIDASGNPIWGYAEDIGDGRGVTLGLYGATTGQGYDDAQVLWSLYGRNLGTGSVSQIISAVKSVQNDPKWQLAMFQAYIQTYWIPTKNLLAPLASKIGGYRALTFGAVLDASMNAGIGDDSSTSWGSEHLVSEALKSATDETSFLTRFLTLRGQYPTERSGEMTKRIAAWQKLLTYKQWNMNNAKILTTGFVYIPANWAVPINITDDGFGLRHASLTSEHMVGQDGQVLPVDTSKEHIEVRSHEEAAASATTWTFAALLICVVMAMVSPVVMMMG